MMLNLIQFIILINTAGAYTPEAEVHRRSNVIHAIDVNSNFQHVDDEQSVYQSQESLKIVQASGGDEAEAEVETPTRIEESSKVKGRRKGSGGSLKGAGTGTSASRGSLQRQLDARYKLEQPVSFPVEESTWLDNFLNSVFSPTYE